MRLAGRDVEVVTAPGVFSGDRLDLGTRVLLRQAPPPPASGDLLDLGCGWGPLALSLALLSPRATTWAVDVNERALELTRENARRLRTDGLRAVRPEQVPDDVGFSAIWSNPPIRVGKAALHALLLRWLPRLSPGAQAHLVVQRAPRRRFAAHLARGPARRQRGGRAGRQRQGLPGAQDHRPDERLSVRACRRVPTTRATIAVRRPRAASRRSRSRSRRTSRSSVALPRPRRGAWSPGVKASARCAMSWSPRCGGSSRSGPGHRNQRGRA